MKRLSIIFIFFSVACLFSACTGNDTNTQSSTTDSTMTTTADSNMTSSHIDTMNNNAGTAMVDDDARIFVKEATTGGMMEVELVKMAQNKAKSPQVKDFGKMMADDHSKANSDLKDIASKKNIGVPGSLTDDQKKDVDKLTKKTGADFDKAYVDVMVDDHKKDVADFKKASGNLNDDGLKNFAANTLPTLQKHLDAMQNIKSKM